MDKQIRKCPHCKAELETGAAFCAHCGSRVDYEESWRHMFEESSREKPEAGICVAQVKEELKNPFVRDEDEVRDKVLNPEVTPWSDSKQKVRFLDTFSKETANQRMEADRKYKEKQEREGLEETKRRRQEEEERERLEEAEDLRREEAKRQRLEEERLRREEAERLRREEEAERQRLEEAERLRREEEAERQRQEEAERLRQEEAERQRREEEAKRQRQEEAERLRQEEAEHLRREEEEERRRLAEELRRLEEPETESEGKSAYSQPPLGKNIPKFSGFGAGFRSERANDLAHAKPKRFGEK